MAEFEVVETESHQFVRAHLHNETIRAETGAMSYIEGGIVVDAPLPRPRDFFRNALSQEPLIRPSFSGSGTVVLEASAGGYHVFALHGDSWILSRGSYWASEGSVELTLHREPMEASFWTGEGFIHYVTMVSGFGTVVLKTDGPVREVVLDNGGIAVEGALVIARTAGIRFEVRRPARTILGSMLSGESMLRTYIGTGRLLMTPLPYWNSQLLSAIEKRQSNAPAVQ
ncbi:MAG: AIM24 family protein [Hyphomicrobiales bacterium]